MHVFNNSVALVVNAGWSFAAFCGVLAGSLAARRGADRARPAVCIEQLV